MRLRYRLHREQVVPVIFKNQRRDRTGRRELFQPALIVLVQARLVVVDEYRGGDVHGVYQTQPFLDTAVANAFLDLAGDIHKIHAGWDVEGQIFGEGLHDMIIILQRSVVIPNGWVSSLV